MPGGLGCGCSWINRISDWRIPVYALVIGAACGGMDLLPGFSLGILRLHDEVYREICARRLI